MAWIDETIDEISRLPAIGYSAGGAAAAEPTALTALAMIQHGRLEAAKKAADALASMQQKSGAVGVRVGEDSPGWPTSLAIVAWNAADRKAHRDRIDRAIDWLLSNRGEGIEQTENFGHNTQLVGWAYAENTHSWVEPTAFAVAALKATGLAANPATREGVSVLLDRQLPGGGQNYGNTYVLGQLLRPHIEPTGIGLIALAGEVDLSGRIAKSLAWLRRSLGPETTPLSLGWGLLGVKAHEPAPPQADDWLSTAASRVKSRDRSPHKLALLALAAKGWPA